MRCRTSERDARAGGTHRQGGEYHDGRHDHSPRRSSRRPVGPRLAPTTTTKAASVPSGGCRWLPATSPVTDAPALASYTAAVQCRLPLPGWRQRQPRVSPLPGHRQRGEKWAGRCRVQQKEKREDATKTPKKNRSGDATCPPRATSPRPRVTADASVLARPSSSTESPLPVSLPPR